VTSPDPTPRGDDVRARLRALTAADPLPPAPSGAPTQPLPTVGAPGGAAVPAHPAVSRTGREDARRPGATSALAVAAARYADAHGVLPGPEPARTRVRWRPTLASVLAAAAALALLVGAVVLRTAGTRPGPPVALPVPLPAQTASAVPVGAAVPPPSAAPTPAEVVVDVAGAVARPQVVRLPVGARVVDAIAAAGGATDDADLARLNLARVLLDGEQVLVPRPGDPVPAPDLAPATAAGGGSGAPGGAGPVDLNPADEATLETLPGIGPVLAGRIVEHRATRPFGSVDELVDVPGIGPALMARLRDRVRV